MSSVTAPIQTRPEAVSRLSWVDVFRGAAVVFMIETHVANTFLRSDLRETDWFTALTYLNGLVAPSFLFIAGYVQGIAWQGGTGRPVSFGRRARRLGMIALIGYGLHFPFPQLWRGEWWSALQAGTQVDVLACLALSLFALLVLTWGLQKLPQAWRNPLWWSVLTGLALAVIWASPMLARWPGLSVPVAFRALLNVSTGSLFPLFPWSAFVFCGALSGAMASHKWIVRLLMVGTMAVLGQAIPSAFFSAASPEFFCERLAWVLGLAMVCERLVRENPPGWLAFAGRESLVMYVGHLALIFLLVGSGVLPERDLAPRAVLGWTLVVMVWTFAVALGKTRWQSAAAKLVEA
ncbi:MAG: putative membrane protein [Verrucomicrobia bacterium]|jgi:uncharacterized membrane protein|nr:MAG: putative membrane protein [Verrucomicrobiota bacterium]